jgi:hypothetical protein
MIYLAVNFVRIVFSTEIVCRNRKEINSGLCFCFFIWIAGILINDEFCGGHTIEYNYVYDCVKETRDHGPFNSWGRERFWSEIFNHPEYVPQGGNVKKFRLRYFNNRTM